MRTPELWDIKTKTRVWIPHPDQDMTNVPAGLRLPYLRALATAGVIQGFQSKAEGRKDVAGPDQR